MTLSKIITKLWRLLAFTKYDLYFAMRKVQFFFKLFFLYIVGFQEEQKTCLTGWLVGYNLFEENVVQIDFHIDKRYINCVAYSLESSSNSSFTFRVWSCYKSYLTPWKINPTRSQGFPWTPWLAFQIWQYLTLHFEKPCFYVL